MHILCRTLVSYYDKVSIMIIRMIMAITKWSVQVSRKDMLLKKKTGRYF